MNKPAWTPGPWESRAFPYGRHMRWSIGHVITHGEHSRLSNLTRTRGEAVITHTEGTSGHEQPE
jgi:hypothetical protein